MYVNEQKRCCIFGAAALCLGSFFVVPLSHAVGTDAGVNIQNTATVNFSVGGSAQTPVTSNTVQTTVDELLDVVVVDDTAGPVAVAAGEAGALLQFSVTNNGNGTEVFRIIADDAVAEGGFDPSLQQLYLESNGLPGLQPGSDTAYVSGSGDPTIAEDETLVVYVASNIPLGLAQGDNGDVEVRAVAQTILDQAGLDDPDAAGWPAPGTSYAGVGDGGGAAVVGTSHDIANLLMRRSGRYQVSDAVVSITKTAVAITDPFGGTSLIPGTILTYQLDVNVSGAGSAEGLVVTDVIPAELEYQPGSLNVAGAPEDDDFAPAGTDNSGFDASTTTVTVAQGTVAGGAPTIVITFDAAIR